MNWLPWEHTLSASSIHWSIRFSSSTPYPMTERLNDQPEYSSHMIFKVLHDGSCDCYVILT